MRRALLATVLACGLLAASPARAGIPVIDIAAVTQLIQQVTYWTQQIQHMVTQVNQLRTTYESMSGLRGFETLLAIAPEARNYLPEDIGPLLDAGTGVGGAYAGISGQMQTILQANAVLPAAMLETLTPEQRALIEDARRAAATLQTLSRSAYGTTSARFAQLQQLVTAITATGDQKAVLELQARIQSEQAMLANERAKLATLYQAAQAQELARAQRARELAVQAIGSLRELPPKAY